MFYSALLVTAEEGRMAEAIAAVEAKGLEVFEKEPEKDRFIAVLESEAERGNAKAFRALLDLPGVRDVSLVVSQEDDGEA